MREYENNKIWYIVLLIGVILLILAIFVDAKFVEKWIVPDGEMDLQNHFYLICLRIIAFILFILNFVVWLTRKMIIKELGRIKSYLKEEKNEISVFKIIPKIKNKSLNIILWVSFSVWAIFIVYSLLINPTIASSLSFEGGLFETLTVILYLISICFIIGKIFLLKQIKYFLVFWLLCYAVFCLFVAGEEISWGQHYFKFKTPDLIQDANVQGEAGLHNIPIPGFGAYYINNMSRYLSIFCGVLIPLLLIFSSTFRIMLHYLNIIPPSFFSQLYFIVAASIPYDKFIQSHYDNYIGTNEVIYNLPSELREITISIAFLIWSYSILKSSVGLINQK